MPTPPKLSSVLKKLSPSKGYAGRATPILATEVALWSNDFQCYEVGTDDDTSVEGQAYFGSEEEFGMDQDSSNDENSLKENTDPNDDSDSTPLPAIQGHHDKTSFAIEPTNIVVNFEHLIELLSSLRCQCGSASSVLERHTIEIATQLFHKCTACSKSFSIEPVPLFNSLPLPKN
jgi:hypothetical protein